MDRMLLLTEKKKKHEINFGVQSPVSLHDMYYFPVVPCGLFYQGGSFPESNTDLVGAAECTSTASAPS